MHLPNLLETELANPEEDNIDQFAHGRLHLPPRAGGADGYAHPGVGVNVGAVMPGDVQLRGCGLVSGAREGLLARSE
jgi:hypothetical protein